MSAVVDSVYYNQYKLSAFETLCLDEAVDERGLADVGRAQNVDVLLALVGELAQRGLERLHAIPHHRTHQNDIHHPNVEAPRLLVDPILDPGTSSQKSV